VRLDAVSHVASRSLRFLAAGLCLALPAAAQQAIPTAHTSSAAFVSALTGAPTTATFDGLPSGQVIAPGASADGISFSYDFEGAELIVTDGTAAGGGAPFDTTSTPNCLGTSDFDMLVDGDDITFGLSAGKAIGIFIVSAEEPGRTLLDGDIRLTAGGATAFLDVDSVEQTLPDGALVFFLGVIDPGASFSSASLETFGGGGAFTYNLDGILTGVPTLCGDIDGNGLVSFADVDTFRLFLADAFNHPMSSAGQGRCRVIGPVRAPSCDVLDVVVTRRSLNGPPLGPGRAQVCAAVEP
jgi:hypothetical protein